MWNATVRVLRDTTREEDLFRLIEEKEEQLAVINAIANQRWTKLGKMIISAGGPKGIQHRKKTYHRIAGKKK